MNELSNVADELEQILDSSNLPAILEALAQICHEKAEHIRENWQDEPLARKWNRAGKALETTSTRHVYTDLPS